MAKYFDFQPLTAYNRNQMDEFEQARDKIRAKQEASVKLEQAVTENEKVRGERAVEENLKRERAISQLRQSLLSLLTEINNKVFDNKALISPWQKIELLDHTDATVYADETSGGDMGHASISTHLEGYPMEILTMRFNEGSVLIGYSPEDSQKRMAVLVAPTSWEGRKLNEELCPRGSDAKKLECLEVASVLEAIKKYILDKIVDVSF